MAKKEIEKPDTIDVAFPVFNDRGLSVGYRKTPVAAEIAKEQLNLSDDDTDKNSKFKGAKLASQVTAEEWYKEKDESLPVNPAAFGRESADVAELRKQIDELTKLVKSGKSKEDKKDMPPAEPVV